MPIVNLTDKPDEAKLPRIAKVHKGDKKGPNGQMGADLDYFRVEFEPEFKEFETEWIEIYGDKLETFERVYLNHSTVDMAFETWKEEWNASQTLLHRCDGENQVLWYNQPAQMYSTAKVACASKKDSPCACKHVGRLDLIIPEFIAVVGIMGFVTVETHSINDILTVYGTLANTQRINGGSLLGIPFTLGRADNKISAPNKKAGTRMKITKSLFYMYPDPDFTREILLPRLAQSGGLLSANQPMLPPTVSAELPKMSIEDAKAKLGPGKIERRMGMEETVGSGEPAITETSATPPPAKTTPEPPKSVGGTIVGIDTVGNALGKLKTRVYEEIFGKDSRRCNRIISELTQAGKLPPAMSIDEAFKVIQEAAKPADDSQQLYDSLPGANDKVEQPTLGGMPAVLQPT